MDQYSDPRDLLLSRFSIIAHLPPSLQASIQAASIASFLPQTSTSADDKFAALSAPTIPESDIHEDLIELTDLPEAIATGLDGSKSAPERRSPPAPKCLRSSGCELPESKNPATACFGQERDIQNLLADLASLDKCKLRLGPQATPAQLNNAHISTRRERRFWARNFR